jgi:Arc/MetJ-type ribon-helix-helix transcriptional regulator
MGRPPGPKKVVLTVTLSEPTSAFLDDLLASGRYETKSLFVQHLIMDAMERDKKGEPLSNQR